MKIVREKLIKLHAFLNTPSTVRTWTAVILLIIAVALPTTINLALNPQDIRRKAQETPSTPPSPPFPPTSTPTPPVAGPDTDGDGFTDVVENVIGTDPLDACADTKIDDAWPPDFDNNTVVNAADAQRLFSFLRPPTQAASNVRRYNKRFDLNADGDVSRLDYDVFLPYLGQTCAGGVTGIPKTPITPRSPLR